MFRSCILVITLVFSVNNQAGNLLKNPGFEAGTQQWKVKNRQAPGPRFSIDKKIKHSGSSALFWQSQESKGYVVASQKLSLKSGRMYRLSAWVKTEDLQGARESGATICMGYEDNNNKYIKGGPHPGGIKGTTDWRQIVAYAGPIPAEVKKGGVALYVRKGRKKSFTGKAWWDDVRLELVPFWCRILKPFYKMTFSDGKNELKLEFETYPEDYKKKISDFVISVKIYDSANRIVFKSEFIPTKRIERKEFALNGLSSGKYLLKAALENKSGQQLWSSSHKLIKAATNHKPAVYIDKYRRTIVNGRPFFPIGVYTRTTAWATKGYKLPKQLELLRDSGFNCIMSYDALNKSQMDACAAANIKVIYSVKNHFCKIWYSPKSIRSKVDEVPEMLKIINRWKKHPALLAWYINDELGPGVLDSHQDHYDAINIADPDHPSWNLHNKPQEMTSMINTCDIIGIDEYPVPEHKLSKVTKAVKNTLEATRKSRALWAVPQIMNLGVHYGSKMPDARPPMLEEMRNMAWQAICAGANGLIFYCLHDCFRDKKFSFDKTWPNIRQMSLEIKKYEPVLLSVKKVPEIKVKAPAFLKWIAKVSNGTIYIFAVNTEVNSINAEFTVAGKIKSIKRINLGKDKAPQVLKNTMNSWSDKFAKNQVHIYKIKLF